MSVFLNVWNATPSSTIHQDFPSYNRITGASMQRAAGNTATNEALPKKYIYVDYPDSQDGYS